MTEEEKRQIPRLGVERKPDLKKIVEYNRTLKYSNMRQMLKLLSKL